MLGVVLKRSLKNVVRVPGRSFLLGTIIFVVAVLVIQGISIEAGAKQTIAEARQSLGNEVVLQPNYQGFQRQMLSSQEGQRPERVELTEAIGEKLINSEYLLGYNYEVMANASSENIDPVEAQTDDSVNQNVNPSYVQQRGGMIREISEFRLQGNSYLELQSDFYNGNKKLIEGRFFTQEEITNSQAVVIIDTLLAEKNSLTLNSTFLLKGMGSEESIEVKVVGIFEDTVQSDMSAPISIMVRANTMYTPYTLAQKLASEGTDRPVDVINSAIYYLKDPTYVDLFKQEAAESGIDLEKYSLSANDAAFVRMVGPLQSLSDFARISIIAVLIAGALILILLMTLITRERKLEIGILRALGASRSSVALQFASEVLIICAIFIFAGTLAGSFVAQKTGDYLLAREVSAQTKVEEERGFLPGMGRGLRGLSSLATVETIDDIEVTVGINQIGQLVLYSLLIGVVGSLVSTYWIMKYEPMNILTNRS